MTVTGTNDGRVALVTGAAAGIGAACAERLAADGYAVAVVDVDASRGEAKAAEVGGLFVHADLTTKDGCAVAVSRTVDELGGLDVLVCNAGVQHIDPLPDFPEEKWRFIIDLMLTAPFLLTKYAWELLGRSGSGRVVHIGSAHSLTASPFKAAYVSAKHGLVGLARVTALEGGERGITCNVVAPAYVRTELVEKQLEAQARTRNISKERVEQEVFLAGLAIKKMLEPSDVADLVAYLASEAAWAITGSVQEIDLGWTAR